MSISRIVGNNLAVDFLLKSPVTSRAKKVGATSHLLLVLWGVNIDVSKDPARFEKREASSEE